MSDALPIEVTSPTPLLELRGISKEFPGVKALDDVSFAVFPGEVHMLLGENGAGKSSLMKVLCGAYRADAGEFYHEGNKVAISSTADAQKLGIAVIFQEFSLVPHLDIAQNIFLGREPKGRIPGTIDRRKILADARRVLEGHRRAGDAAPHAQRSIGHATEPGSPLSRVSTIGGAASVRRVSGALRSRRDNCVRVERSRTPHA